MFQFTKERIINSVKYDDMDIFQGQAEDKSTNKEAVLRILPGDNFYKDSKLGKTSKITKTAYEAPVMEKLVATVKMPDKFDATKESNIFRLSIIVIKVDEYQSDYVDATTYNQKQLWYEGKGTTAAEVAKSLYESAKNEKNQSANAYVKIEYSDAQLTITCTDYAQQLVAVELQQVFTPLNSTTGYTTLTGADSYKVIADLLTEGKSKGTLTVGKVGFGTTRQLMKDHQLPTAAKTNWLASHQDERPVPGGEYNQYQMTIETTRDNMGSDVVGQTVISKTNHIFYILNGTVSAAFEAAAKTAGLEFAAKEEGSDILEEEETEG
jgi:hypothetical protein